MSALRGGDTKSFVRRLLEWPVVTSRTAAALGMGVATVFVLSCGGGGSSATATPAPSPSATPDAVATYRNTVTTDGAKLQQNMDQLNQDLQSANENQADPKWPDVLSADIQLVANTATELNTLEPPSDAYKDFAANLTAATSKILDGTRLLTTSITNRDQSAGAQAYVALTAGRAMLDAALSSLPAE